MAASRWLSCRTIGSLRKVGSLHTSSTFGIAFNKLFDNCSIPIQNRESVMSKCQAFQANLKLTLISRFWQLSDLSLPQLQPGIGDIKAEEANPLSTHLRNGISFTSAYNARLAPPPARSCPHLAGTINILSHALAPQRFFSRTFDPHIARSSTIQQRDGIQNPSRAALHGGVHP